MIDVKPVEQARRSLSEMVRGLVYPVVPILCVVCVWAYAYAGSLESRLERDLQPREEENFASREYANRQMTGRLAAAHENNHPVAGLHVSSINDDGN